MSLRLSGERGVTCFHHKNAKNREEFQDIWIFWRFSSDRPLVGAEWLVCGVSRLAADSVEAWGKSILRRDEIREDSR